MAPAHTESQATRVDGDSSGLGPKHDTNYSGIPVRVDPLKCNASHLNQDITANTTRDVPYADGSGTYFRPGIARANVAATLSKPDGTSEDDWNVKHADETVLQQHCSYFDKDQDGVIWPLETWVSLSDWGWSLPLVVLGVVIIHGGLSYATQATWLPDPLFRIYQGRVHRAKHGSDSTSFDKQGRFRGSSFEEFFANYDRDNKGGLSKRDLWNAWSGQRDAFDFFGWSAVALEWFATYLLLWPDDGILRKEDVRRVYDGSIFQQKADEYAEKQNQKRHPTLQKLQPAPF